MTFEIKDPFTEKVMLNAMSQREDIKELMKELEMIPKTTPEESKLAKNIYSRLAIILNNVSEN